MRHHREELRRETSGGHAGRIRERSTLPLQGSRIEPSCLYVAPAHSCVAGSALLHGPLRKRRSIDCRICSRTCKCEYKHGVFHTKSPICASQPSRCALYATTSQPRVFPCKARGPTWTSRRPTTSGQSRPRLRFRSMRASLTSGSLSASTLDSHVFWPLNVMQITLFGGPRPVPRCMLLAGQFAIAVTLLEIDKS